MNKKPKVMITFSEHGGGPYSSHKRIIESELNEKYNFVPLIVPRARVLLSISGMRNFVKRIKEEKPDILHFTGLQLEGFLVSIACRLAKVRSTVLAIRGSSNEAIEFSWWKKFIVSVLENRTLKMATVCYGVSNYVVNWKKVKKNAQYCYGYVYNLPPSEFKASNDISFRDEMGFDNDQIIITSTGRVTREKGFEILLETIKITPFSDIIKFVIAGKGEYFDTMKKEIEKSGLGERVFLLGYRDDIDKVLSESDIFVLCSLHETLCNSIIEAGKQKLPSVATNIGGIPEIIKDGYNGFLVEVNDPVAVGVALHKLVLDHQLRYYMGNNARKVIDENFNPESILAKIDEIYTMALNRGCSQQF